MIFPCCTSPSALHIICTSVVKQMRAIPHDFSSALKCLFVQRTHHASLSNFFVTHLRPPRLPHWLNARNSLEWCCRDLDSSIVDYITFRQRRVVDRLPDQNSCHQDPISLSLSAFVAHSCFIHNSPPPPC